MTHETSLAAPGAAYAVLPAGSLALAVNLPANQLGIIGAALGGWFISPLVGVGSINDGSFSVGALVVSLLGAIVLLAIVNLVRRGSPR